MIAVIPQAPTLRIFLFPILMCSLQIQKKLSYNCLQLQEMESLRIWLMLIGYLLLSWGRCCLRQLSIKVFILHLEYSASSGPPCPSKMLTVYASKNLSCSYTIVSSHGLLAQYCRLFTRLSIMFFLRSYSRASNREVYWVLSQHSSCSEVLSLRLLMRGSTGMQWGGFRRDSYELSVECRPGLVQGRALMMQPLNFSCAWRSLQAPLKQGIINLAILNWFIEVFIILIVEAITVVYSHIFHWQFIVSNFQPHPSSLPPFLDYIIRTTNLI